MRVTLWGTRGSLGAPGPETIRYGGNTSCVEVEGRDGTRLILDAGTGIRRLGARLGPEVGRVDVLLTHLHMDHIQGLGFFRPLDEPGQEVHLWGPPSSTLDLGARLSRYLSPPLFPVRLSELPCRLALHNVPLGRFEIGGVRIDAALITHPGPTVGYRIDDGETCLAYLPDHEPALGASKFPLAAAWTSGFDLAEGADLLIHDTQYSAMEYSERVGWGHSTVAHALEFARLAGVKRFLAFHHDPGHDDVMLDRMLAEARTGATYPFEIIPGIEGTQLKV